eukprot:835926_1
MMNLCVYCMAIYMILLRQCGYADEVQIPSQLPNGMPTIITVQYDHPSSPASDSSPKPTKNPKRSCGTWNNWCQTTGTPTDPTIPSPQPTWSPAATTTTTTWDLFGGGSESSDDEDMI